MIDDDVAELVARIEWAEMDLKYQGLVEALHITRAHARRTYPYSLTVNIHFGDREVEGEIWLWGVQKIRVQIVYDKHAEELPGTYTHKDKVAIAAAAIPALATMIRRILTTN